VLRRSHFLSDTPASDPRTFIYTLDRRDRIVALNDDWLDFARENGAAHLTRASVEQQSLWNFVTGPETQSIYEAILQRVRFAQIAMHFSFRCDSPDRRRFMQMDVSPLSNGGIRIACRMRRIEPRQAIVWPGNQTGGEPRLVAVCSSCRKIELPSGAWVEIEEATSLLQASSDEPLPALSHGFCPPCGAEWLNEIRS